MPATRFVASSLRFLFPFLSFVSSPLLTTVLLSLPKPVSNTVQLSFWKAGADLAGQQSPCYLRNPDVHCDVYKISPLDPKVKQFNPHPTPHSHAFLNCFSCGATAVLGQGRLIVDVSRSHSATPHTVGLLWTRDRSWPLPDNTKYSQQTDIMLPAGFEPAIPSASGHRPTP